MPSRTILLLLLFQYVLGLEHKKMRARGATKRSEWRADNLRLLLYESHLLAIYIRDGTSLVEIASLPPYFIAHLVVNFFVYRLFTDSILLTNISCQLSAVSIQLSAFGEGRSLPVGPVSVPATYISPTIQSARGGYGDPPCE